MKKKILGIIMAFALVFTGLFGFAGCGKKDEMPATPESSEETVAELTEDQMLAKLQAILRTRAEYDGTYEMTNTQTATPTQDLLDLVSGLEEERAGYQAQLAEAQAANNEEAISQLTGAIAQIDAALGNLNNLMMNGVQVFKMGYDKENNRAYQISSKGLTADEQFTYDYGYFVEQENADPTKKYLAYEKYYNDFAEQFEYKISFVSANYVKNTDFMGEEESAQQESLMKLTTILSATSIANLKQSISDFAIVKVDGGYKASYSFSEESSAMANGLPTKNKAVVYFNNNYLTKVELEMTLQIELYSFGMPGAEEGDLTDMVIMAISVDMAYGQFTAANMAEIENANFNVDDADYRTFNITIKSQDGDYIGNCNAKYLEKYSDLSNIIFENSAEPVSLATYVQTHTLYTDEACTIEFVYNANAIIPDVDLTLYEIVE